MASKDQQQKARNDLAAARQNLAAVSSGITEETPEYRTANRQVIAAEEAAKTAGVPWWRR